MKIITFSHDELAIIRYHAKNCELGGKSNIRTRDRLTTLSSDQLTGQLGEAALHKWIFGSLDKYHSGRNKIDALPRGSNDGGTDIQGAYEDVKTSRMRAGEYHLYWLWVREREYKPETIYYLALIPMGKDDTVYLVGWAHGKYMQYEPEYGRYALRQDKLNGMDAGLEIPDGKIGEK